MVLLLLVLVGAGAGGYLHYTGAFISPAELKATINSALAANAMSEIAVEVGDDRVATLNGLADDAAMKDAAVQLARSVKGVKDVLAKLDVLPSIGDTESRLAQTLKDQQLTEVLVRVDEKRNATLTGNVSDAAMIEVATKAAAATPGVKNVTSQLQVVEAPPVTYRADPQPEAASQPLPRPSSPPKIKRPAVAGGSPSSVPTPAPVPERKRTTCEGTGGINRLTCMIEGPATYFKCAPDGRNWNNSIPGCDRSGGRN